MKDPENAVIGVDGKTYPGMSILADEAPIAPKPELPNDLMSAALAAPEDAPLLFARYVASKMISDHSDPLWSDGCREILAAIIMRCSESGPKVREAISEIPLEDYADLAWQYNLEAVPFVEKITVNGEKVVSKTTRSLVAALKSDLDFHYFQ